MRAVLHNFKLPDLRRCGGTMPVAAVHGVWGCGKWGNVFGLRGERNHQIRSQCEANPRMIPVSVSRVCRRLDVRRLLSFHSALTACLPLLVVKCSRTAQCWGRDAYNLTQDLRVVEILCGADVPHRCRRQQPSATDKTIKTVLPTHTYHQI